MKTIVIKSITAHDMRFELAPGEGDDAIHQNPQYSYAVCALHTDGPITGIGLAFTLGRGNELVCGAIEHLAAGLAGQEIESLMRGFGATFRRLADNPQLRWLGAHKGVVHLALASVVNACFDLWAKSRGLPLWKLLASLSPGQITDLLDFSFLEDVLSREQAHALLEEEWRSRPEREAVLRRGYTGYDTSVGWFNYPDEQIRENTRCAVDRGFRAMKLKVGSSDTARDVRRAAIVREAAGDACDVMLDANQQWSLPVAVRTCLALSEMNPYWIEEPTHPDDVLAHQTLARAIAPVRIATGEHLPHRVAFKNFLQAGAMQFCQVDCTRVGGVSEFLTVSLLARKYGVPVVPHVGDMGQIHQHLVLFNHIAMGHEALFLEYIPHLREHFVHPAQVEEGVYRTPMEPGSSSDLVRIS